MNSLRLRLFLMIAAATALVWSLAAAWTVLSARADVERVLDARLREAAVMVASLGYTEDSTVQVAAEPAPLSLPSYERQLSCQIWSVGGDLLGVSKGAPAQALSSGHPGFSEPIVDGIAWRVYTYVAPDTGLRIMVGDTQTVRRQLITGLLQGLLIPALIGLIALAALLWIGVGRGLAPVRKIAGAIAARAPDDQSPLEIGHVPHELLPLTQEIDELFARIALLRFGEKRFLASAAHEMQTPLAGLRTHADIALRAPDHDTRERALERIRQSVDRTARLVRQLLEWSRHDTEQIASTERALLGPAVTLVADELEHLLQRRQVSLNVADDAGVGDIPLSQDALVIALRNLVENAALHGPTNSPITVGTTQDGFYVEDHGEGIAPDDVSAMLEPFIRGSATNLPGSGLGLAIALSALSPRMVLQFEKVNGRFRVSATQVGLAGDKA
ncbi:histidine kinase dimerization/phospho-acceptor domain-containing protein [Roseibium sp.]|uniref:histidine kinase dimerization/phospho-acceptor domain-containing protein n=1 Tax=Roseibium sp. TaxID=1936156 RepID=UPI00329842FE